MKKLFISIMLLIPICLSAQFGDYPFSRTQLGLQTTKNQYLLVPTTGVPSWTPVADTNAIFAIDTTNAILYGYFGATWDTVATSAAIVAESDPVWLTDSTNYARKTYADQAEADAKAYADANDTDTQLTPAQVVGISRDSSFLEQLSTLGVIEEEGQTPENFNQSDTLYFNLSFTADPGGASVWSLNGSDAQYGAGDVRVSNDLFVDGDGYEYLSTTEQVIKLVPTDKVIETLTWGALSSSGANYGIHPDSSGYLIPPYSGDTTAVTYKGWAKVASEADLQEDTIQVYLLYDTTTYQISQSPDASSYLSAYLNAGAYQGDIKSIWWNDVRFSSPNLSSEQLYPNFYIPFTSLDTIWSNPSLSLGQQTIYNRVPIDSTGTETIVVNQLDTTEYGPGYLDFMTRYQVDSMIGASILGDASLLDVEELYVNPIFLGFGSLDELGRDVANMGLFGPVAVAQAQMMAFGTEAYLTVRSTASRPVNFRAVDEDLSLGVEISTISDAGDIKVYDDNNAVTSRITGGAASNINDTYMRTDRWGTSTTNATIADTLRTETLSIGPTSIGSSGEGSHTSNALITSSGQFNITSIAPEQLNLPTDSVMNTYSGASLVKVSQLQSGGNYQEKFVTLAGVSEIELNSDQHSIITNGLGLVPDPTDTLRAQFHIKQDIQDQALAYTFANTPTAIFENFENDINFVLLSDEGANITFASDADEDEAAIDYNVGDGKFNIRTNATDRLTILDGGNVGIGTDSPGRKLDVDGDLKLAVGSGEIGLELETGNGRNMEILAASTGANNDPFVFATNNTFAFQVDADTTVNIDNAGVGIYRDPQYALDVQGEITARRDGETGNIRMINNEAGPSAFFRNDGGAFYLLESDTYNGSFSAYRPITWNFTDHELKLARYLVLDEAGRGMTWGGSYGGNNFTTTFSNTSNTASSDVVHSYQVGGSSGGDIRIQYTIPSVGTWYTGMHNGDNQKLKWDWQNVFSPTPEMSLTKTGNLTVSGTVTTGDGELTPITETSSTVELGTNLIQFGSYSASGSTLTVTYGTAFSATPKVTIGYTGTRQTTYRITSSSSTGFTVEFGSFTSGHEFDYQAIGPK